MPQSSPGGSSAAVLDSERAAPTGTGDYVVQDGECVASIAFEHGFFWETIWNDPGNLELKRCRKTPFVLLPGDRVTIPELRGKYESRSTDQRHRFVRKGVPAIVKIKVLELPSVPDTPDSPPPAEDEGQEGAELVVAEAEESSTELEPAANKPCLIIVDGTIQNGKTDGDGAVMVAVTPSARDVHIIMEPGTPRERAIPVRLGSLDPVEDRGGQAQRLANLGFNVDPTGQDADGLSAAVAEFQRAQGLNASGHADAATLDKLKQIHGS